MIDMIFNTLRIFEVTLCVMFFTKPGADSKNRAMARFALNQDLTFMQFHDLIGEIQPDACPFKRSIVG